MALKPATENPWYVLATLWGEQTGDRVDRDLHAKNRRGWNAWACQGLSEAERQTLAADDRHDLAELSAWPELGGEIARRFRARLRPEVRLPDPAEDADLSATDFDARAVWDGVVFPQDARFDGSTFTRDARFSGATFMREAWFHSATFTQDAWFDGATFTQNAWFGGATFMEGAVFFGATFAQIAWFEGAIFTQVAGFGRATFMQDAGFDNATFTRDAGFDGATFTQDARFNSATFKGNSHFSSAEFQAKALFADCQFERPVTFREARFLMDYPELHGAVLPKTVEFTAKDRARVRIKAGRMADLRFWPERPPTDQHGLERARENCAKIRHALGQQGLPEEEHFFFRKEMALATRIGGWPDRLPYLLFGWLSGFGASILIPVLWLIGVFTVPYLIYLFPINFGVVQGTGWTAAGLSFANTFSFLGLQKTYFAASFLVGLPGWMVALGVAQSVLGIVALFFLGLGLRTRFRLR